MRNLFDDSSDDAEPKESALRLPEIGGSSELDSGLVCQPDHFLQRQWRSLQYSDDAIFETSGGYHGCPEDSLYSSLQSPVVYTVSSMSQSVQSSEEESQISGKRSPRRRKATKTKCVKKTESEDVEMFKKMRNRMSAQKSRDKKKKELEDLQEENQMLRIENEQLKQQLTEAETKISSSDYFLKGILNEVEAVLGKAGAAKIQRHSALMATVILSCLCFSVCFSSLSSKNPTIKELAPSHKTLIQLVSNQFPASLTTQRKTRRAYIEARGRQILSDSNHTKETSESFSEQKNEITTTEIMPAALPVSIKSEQLRII